MSAEERISKLDDFIRSVESKVKCIYEKLNNELQGDMSRLTDEEKRMLKENKNELEPLRAEMVALKRSRLSKAEKREQRKILIDLARKFFHENDNLNKAHYYEVYLRLLDTLEPMLTNDQKLCMIYEFLDAKDFQFSISEEYLSMLENYNTLKDVMLDIRTAMIKLQMPLK
jgi:hypothetical protein